MRHWLTQEFKSGHVILEIGASCTSKQCFMQRIDHTAVDNTQVRWDRIVYKIGFSETAWTMMAFLSYQLDSPTRSKDTRTLYP